MNRSLYLSLLFGTFLLFAGHIHAALPAKGKVLSLPSNSTQTAVFAQFNLSDALQTTQIKWKLQKHEEVAFVYVERSSDGLSFEMVGAVRSNKSHYTFQDIMPRPGDKVFYRLKAILESGKAVYSDIQQLRYTHSAELLAYPNPVQSFVSLRLPTGLRSAQVSVYDNNGRPIQTHNWEPTAYGHPGDMTLNLNGLNRGFYLIKATDGVREWHTKVFKR